MSGIALGLVILLIVPTASAAQNANPVPYPALVVRTFDRFGVSAGDLQAVRADVIVILQKAGIAVSWLDCWDLDREPAGAAPQCRLPLGSNEVILRIQSADAAPGASYVPMGVSLVNCRDEAPRLSTVYADEVASVARSAGIDPRELLARVIVHEIGHLLLDNPRHAKGGLMRAVWSQSELRRNHARDWSFRKEEARMMRTAVFTRMAQAN